MIDIVNLKKDYKSKSGVITNALKDINLKIDNKGLIFIVGKSGSGKSTLLNLIGGLDGVDEGKILVNNKDLTKFTEKEYDSYRNTHIGFIFQDFNLLEQYNVIENIELSCELQDNKIDKDEINKLLTQLEINELQNRKINELSGGQKQRVSIARALIKKPKILLCDEPTGNLDINTGSQIFNVLKEISKERLVIIVSHDIESAKKYADRIIHIEDGNIVSDESRIEDEDLKEELNLINSNLPIKYALKMIKRNFKTKFKKLLMTILITSITLVFMGFSTNLSLFNDSRFVASHLKDNDNYEYKISHLQIGYDGSVNPLSLNEEKINKIKQITNSKVNITYVLNNNEESLNFEYGEESKNIDTNEKEYTYDLSQPYTYIYFTELEDDRLLKNIIGDIPTKENEMVIHKYMADFIIKYGIKDINNEIYFPKDYNELISSKRKLKMGENSVIITGIIDDNKSSSYALLGNKVFVKGFTKSAKLNNDPTSIVEKIGIIDIVNNDRITILNTPVKAITKNGEEEITKLKENEVIVTIDDLKKLDIQFDSKFNEYMLKNKDGIYEDLINEYLKIYFNNDNYLLTAPKLITNYISENNIKEMQMNVIGVSLDNNVYISNKFIEEYEYQRSIAQSVTVYDDNINNLIKSFDQMVFYADQEEYYGKEVYAYSTEHSLEIGNILGVYKYINIFLFIVAMIFIVFAFLQFSNFVGTSISESKKEIGILRALGASSKDIIKIYGYESIILALISWVVSLIGYLLSIKLVNYFLGYTENYILNVVVLNPLSILIMLFVILLISIMISVFYIKKISKIKPIEVILNK